ncbi:hypothetical protein HanPI659440_Chr09g0324821 [Helianthus annuus]|uniref:Uncharacterized protein n=1 Tax=Helianthus annuus TaxID=4232 RepID=A0A251UJ48_HELAN|nr:hypothetical protein HanHA300_Chr06g0212781 [Helianthus annuus]KAJ0573594.1 hypothetical protein HanHA89_Chr06g0228481 [Helianthus annuus]KAJ0737957.1 hypothetical protein HanLR1_Chr06g0212711 [Helianthus annuus]KAJ0740837.1 hypothetical protein HanOQP8_Chr06g0221211 [Helianthus annuus]KAJ0752477.1 hypothetical protein HanPI659440_Chr09g0324821 [Helianthus annuus]
MRFPSKLKAAATWKVDGAGSSNITEGTSCREQYSRSYYAPELPHLSHLGFRGPITHPYFKFCITEMDKFLEKFATIRIPVSMVAL